MSPPVKRVIVIGAQGTLGRICAGALTAAGFNVTRAGRRPESAEDFRLIDLDDPASVAAGIQNVDLVVTTVRHSSFSAERAVLRQGGTLLSVASLNQEEARRLLVTALGRPNAARWSVALALGLRQGEALGLTWSGIDLDTGTLTVLQALQRQTYRHGCGDSPTDAACGRVAKLCPHSSGGMVMTDPKSRAGRRVIALPAPLLATLKTHRAEQLAQRLAAGEFWEDHDLVFANELGRPVQPRRDWSNWKRLLKDAGVRDAPARRQAYSGDPAPSARRRRESRHGDPRPQPDKPHAEQLPARGPELARDAAAKMAKALWD